MFDLIMFERLITLCSERLITLFLFIKSLRTCLFLRLFLPPRLRRLLRLYILTAVTPDLPFYHLLVGDYYPYLLSSQFYRWAEIGDITTVGS